MFGSIYSRYPKILLSSFSEMKEDYEEKTAEKSVGPIIQTLQKVYITIFGIPEIGFQVRSLYFRNALLKNLKKSKIHKILDAGSGIGAYSFWLGSKYPKAEVNGVDVDKNKLRFSNLFSKELGVSNVKFYYSDVSKIKEKNKYNLIVNIDVLEHIKNYKKTIKNFYVSLKKGGYLYIHTPQIEQKRFFKQLKHWHHEDHAREGYDPKKLKKELEKLGFNILDIRNTFGPFGSLAWELNHIALSKGFVIAGAIYPLLWLIAQVDTVWKNNRGLGVAILAKKN